MAYLEGIFVAEPFRKLGIAKKPINHAKKWARGHGCHELGSDTEINEPIRKLPSFELFLGGHARRSAIYLDIHEHSST